MPERVALTDDDVVVAIKDFSPGIVDPKSASPGAGSSTIVTVGGAQESGTRGCVANVDGSLGPGFKLTQSYAEPVPAAYDQWGPSYRPAEAPYRWLAASNLITPTITQLAGEQEYNNLDAIAIAYAEYIAADNAGVVTSGQGMRESCGWNIWSQAGSATDPLVEFANWQTRMDTNFFSTGADIPFRQITSDLVVGWNVSSRDANNTIRRSLFWLASTHGYDLQVVTGGDWFTWPDPEALIAQARRNASLGVAQPIGYTNPVPSGTYHQSKLVTTTPATNPSPPTPVVPFSPILSNFVVQPMAGYLTHNPTDRLIDNGTGTAFPYVSLLVIGSEDYNITGLLSMNADTLFITQMVGGCTAIRGPLEKGQMTALASVPPTGVYFSQPTRTKIGAVYATATGIYAWNEGNQVTDLSANLPGRFWVTPGTAYEKSFMLQRRGKLNAMGKWLFVPNDFFCNIDSGAWWRFPTKPDPETPPYQHYEVTSGNRVYAIPAYQAADTTTLWNQYDMTRPEDGAGKTWSWKSHVLPDILKTRGAVCREIKVVASGFGTVTFTVEGGDTSSGASITVTNHPQVYRVDTAVHTINSARGTNWGTTLTINATGNGTGPLPTVHSVEMVFTPKQSIPRAN